MVPSPYNLGHKTAIGQRYSGDFALHTADAAVCRNPPFPLEAQAYSESIGKLIGDKT
jgi:hypothetical protein